MLPCQSLIARQHPVILDTLRKIANYGSSLTRDEARDIMAEVFRQRP